jgi:hypothetical protein
MERMVKYFTTIVDHGASLLPMSDFHMVKTKMKGGNVSLLWMLSYHLVR